jgi:sulfate adenylyltransferase subunit 2
MTETSSRLTTLQLLEAEAIDIIREVAATFERPLMLYSVGKDSSVMAHLARKAFHPAPLPFPLLHVDTTWKFPEMYAFRDRFAEEIGAEILVHTNWEGKERGANPFTWGSVEYTNVMKTQGLLQALSEGRYDAAFGGARRDEEKSRAKERIFSFRDENGRWDPKNQRPELWSLYNAEIHKGESIRVFPLSNWTELDIWQYIMLEEIPICDLYFAAERPMVRRDNLWIPFYEDKFVLREGEKPETVHCRFRTLGCWPLTAAVESDADTLEKILAETMVTRQSERTTRVIDFDQEASMETKKREGYF